MKIQYLGHSAFYVESDNMKALIDPFINEDITEFAFDYSDINYIFVTHGHGDHLGKTIEIANQSNALVICNYEIYLYLSKLDIACRPMHIGGRAEMDFGRVKMTPALHGSCIDDPELGIIYGGNPCGFVIESQGKKLYHAGDTGLTMDMQLLAQENIDVALLPIGGNFTMDVEDAVRALEFICPKIAIPMHYNTFPIISASPEDFKQKVKNTTVKIMNIGEIFSF